MFVGQLARGQVLDVTGANSAPFSLVSDSDGCVAPSPNMPDIPRRLALPSLPDPHREQARYFRRTHLVGCGCAGAKHSRGSQVRGEDDSREGFGLDFVDHIANEGLGQAIVEVSPPAIGERRGAQPFGASACCADILRFA